MSRLSDPMIPTTSCDFYVLLHVLILHICENCLQTLYNCLQTSCAIFLHHIGINGYAVRFTYLRQRCCNDILSFGFPTILVLWPPNDPGPLCPLCHVGHCPLCHVGHWFNIAYRSYVGMDPSMQPSAFAWPCMGYAPVRRADLTSVDVFGRRVSSNRKPLSTLTCFTWT